MENISENRRGRPLAMTVEQESVLAACGVFDRCFTRRSKMNVFYRQRALGVLDKDYKWLFDAEKIMGSTDSDKHWQPTILVELGRIDDEETMRAVAAQICEMKPKTTVAVQMIRRFRVGGLPVADSLQLANAIIRTINEYLHSHVGASKKHVDEALATAQGMVAESIL